MNLVTENVGSFTFTHTFSAGVSSGQLYQFKYRASNQQGNGAFSGITTIKAAKIPDPITSIVTANSGTDVVITWPDSPDSHGSAITSYQVKFLQSDDVTLTEETANCSSALNFGRTCTIPMSVFRSAPYSLAIGTVIKGQVTSTNIKGTSAPSTLNSSGATVQNVPQSSPTLTKGTLNSTTQAQMNWTLLTTLPANGGSVITEYIILWDSGLNNDVYNVMITITDTAQTQYTKSGLTQGTAYKFKI